MVNIRVPASTANLGPGFDCLGLGLSLYMTCQAEALEAGAVNITGCPARYCNADNLVYRAFLHALTWLNKPPMGLSLRLSSGIPLARGLGSSAAAIACGALAAYALSGEEVSRDELFQLTAGLEGHPDNAAAAVYGGLRASMADGDAFRSVAFPLYPGWRFTALIPGFELSTREARAALPASVPHGDAVFNAGRAVLLMKALETGDAQLLRAALEDRLHQPYRLKLIAGGAAVWRGAESLGAAVFLSGAGPTLMGVHRDEALTVALSALLPPGWQALPLSADTQGAQIQSLQRHPR